MARAAGAVLGWEPLREAAAGRRRASAEEEVSTMAVTAPGAARIQELPESTSVATG
ncbi:hypothetical protein GCM10023100_17360 [Actinocorallia cavernae]|uniref:Uncharacterized protein n=2 Tax=Actinomycetes TaxID=1760 RepID=A0ABP8SFV1_9ACTN|nr:hypothetical protein SRO_1677 [Streptomyces rochei]